MQKKQAEDPDISPLIQWKKRAGVRPTWSNVSSSSSLTKLYLAQWESLELVRGLLFRRLESDRGGEVRNLLLAPKSIREEILKHLHCSSTGGHLGVRKTEQRVHHRFYWINWRRFVRDWCRKCGKCAARKGQSRQLRAPLQIYNVGSPMEKVAIDILGPLPRTDSGNKYILVA